MTYLIICYNKEMLTTQKETCSVFNFNSISKHCFRSSSISHCIWVNLSLSSKTACCMFSSQFSLVVSSSTSKSLTCKRKSYPISHINDANQIKLSFIKYVKTTCFNRYKNYDPNPSRMEGKNSCTNLTGLRLRFSWVELWSSVSKQLIPLSYNHKPEHPSTKWHCSCKERFSK